MNEIYELIREIYNLNTDDEIQSKYHQILNYCKGYGHANNKDVLIFLENKKTLLTVKKQ